MPEATKPRKNRLQFARASLQPEGDRTGFLPRVSARRLSEIAIIDGGGEE
jgi:hypothetical protein